MMDQKDLMQNHNEGKTETSGSMHGGEQDNDPGLMAMSKRLTRQIDMRILGSLIPLYSLSLIDRSNLGGARISGIDGVIGLDKGSRYSVLILVFYATYVLFELPSNMALKKFGAHRWLPFLAVLFGLCTLGTGLAHNYATVLALRIILGGLEAGMFPGCIYLISAWYPRYQIQKRLAAMFATSNFLSSFANILAYGLTQISDDPENKGWRWIFIVQGAITIGVGILAWLFMPDFPESPRNKFLTTEEMQSTKARLIIERGDAEAGKITRKVIMEACSDWYTWTIAIVYMGGSCGIYSFLFFLPIILRNGLEFSQAQAFCLSTPPAAFAVIFSLVISWLCDKLCIRGPFVVGECLIGVTGLAITGFSGNPTARYVGTFLGSAGVTALVSTALAWGQNNIRDDAKRSVVTVIQVFCAAVGGVYSSLVFRQQDSPDYVPGIIAIGSLLLFGACLASVTIFLLWRRNRRADRGEIIIENSPDFRHTL